MPVESLVEVTPKIDAITLHHFQGKRSVTINADTAPGSALGESLNYLKDFTLHNLKGVSPAFQGYSDTFLESEGQFGFIFAAAILVVYLFLVAVFNSFIDPFVVLLTVPLSMLGALALLHLKGESLNVYSNIGLVTLVGLITKQGILIVDFANNLRREGMALREATIQAAKLRVRPILMTTAAMTLGVVPLALAKGAGSECRHPLGWILIGGLTFGTLLTLFVIPAVYSYLGALESKKEVEIDEEAHPDAAKSLSE